MSRAGNRKWASRRMSSPPSPGFNARLRQADEDYAKRMAVRAKREAEIKAKLAN